MNQEEERELRKVVSAVVESGESIEETIRKATLEALARHHLETAAIRRAAGAVLEGALEGATRNPPRARESLREAVTGLDRALSTAALALELAAKEAGSEVAHFTGEHLTHVRDDLQGLGGLLVETLREAARAGQGTAAGILKDLADHLATTKTAVASQVEESTARLAEWLKESATRPVSSGLGAAREATAAMARIAAGMLEGLADKLSERKEEEGT